MARISEIQAAVDWKDQEGAEAFAEEEDREENLEAQLFDHRAVQEKPVTPSAPKPASSQAARKDPEAEEGGRGDPDLGGTEVAPRKSVPTVEEDACDDRGFHSPDARERAAVLPGKADVPTRIAELEAQLVQEQREKHDALANLATANEMHEARISQMEAMLVQKDWDTNAALARAAAQDEERRRDLEAQLTEV